MWERNISEFALTFSTLACLLSWFAAQVPLLTTKVLCFLPGNVETCRCPHLPETPLSKPCLNLGPCLTNLLAFIEAAW
jgi:hypothetical protein